MKENYDSQYDSYEYQIPEAEHAYGKNVHILKDPLLLTWLSKLSSIHTKQPQINFLLQKVYENLIHHVVSSEFEHKLLPMHSRMSETEPKARVSMPTIDPEQRVVTVNLARAGTLPSHFFYETLNHILNPDLVRQDHISIARVRDESEHVKGALISGHKIGGKIDNAMMIFPDPMGATGSTLIEMIDLYSKFGNPKKWISVHVIVTPEFIKNVHQKNKEVKIYAARLDRGLSSKEVLQSKLGSHRDQEKGLNDIQYIVPGAGGLGEVLNNAFV